MHTATPTSEPSLYVSLSLTSHVLRRYNATLRACSGVAYFVERASALCCGNQYPASLHTISAGLVKLSAVQRVCPLYRGMAGVRLPDVFLSADAFGARGGVEFGFLSATADREVAYAYAASCAAGVLYELSPGLIDRGADLSWLSQYPREKEVCFPPLTGLSPGAAARVDGSVLVVELLPSIHAAWKGGTATEPQRRGGRLANPSARLGGSSMGQRQSRAPSSRKVTPSPAPAHRKAPTTPTTNGGGRPAQADRPDSTSAGNPRGTRTRTQVDDHLGDAIERRRRELAEAVAAKRKAERARLHAHALGQEVEEHNVSPPGPCSDAHAAPTGRGLSLN